MIRILRTPIRTLLILGASLCLLILPEVSSAQRHGAARARPHPHVSREGPARNGSFHSERRSTENRQRAEHARHERAPLPDRRQGGIDAPRRERPPNQERFDEARQERREDRREIAEERPADSRRERVEERRDYYDDRREDYVDDRRLARGVRYSSVWWNSNSCSNTDVVVVDGYSYYRCEDNWFGRTYYGGEVTYTVIDPPPGY